MLKALNIVAIHLGAYFVPIYYKVSTSKLLWLSLKRINKIMILDLLAALDLAVKPENNSKEVTSTSLRVKMWPLRDGYNEFEPFDTRMIP